MNNNTIYIIVGPTSTGKTSLALDLCRKHNGEIISADSRQVCKDMDIGTGKIPMGSDISIEKKDKHWIVDDIKIWGYDLTSPDEYFSGYDYALFTLEKIREILEKGKKVFIVGGTGFYIDIITNRIELSGNSPDFELRKSLETTSTEDLLSNLMSLNPKVYSSIDKDNRRRIIRALENELTEEKESTPLPYLKDTNFKYIGLTSNNKYLYQRSDTWVDNIWENGLIDEVKKLIDLGFKDSPKLNGLVYKSVVSYLDNENNEISEEETIERIKFDIHAYIRRQITYFKKNNDVEWFDISSENFRQSIYNLING